MSLDEYLVRDNLTEETKQIRRFEHYITWEKPIIKSIGRYYQRSKGIDRAEGILLAIQNYGELLREKYEQEEKRK